MQKSHLQAIEIDFSQVWNCARVKLDSLLTNTIGSNSLILCHWISVVHNLLVVDNYFPIKNQIPFFTILFFVITIIRIHILTSIGLPQYFYPVL